MKNLTALILFLSSITISLLIVALSIEDPQITKYQTVLEGKLTLENSQDENLILMKYPQIKAVKWNLEKIAYHKSQLGQLSGNPNPSIKEGRALADHHNRIQILKAHTDWLLECL